MEFLRLSLGLLLPWSMGYFWLQLIERRWCPGLSRNTFRQLGYGLFLGYAALQGVILASAALFGEVAYWPVLSVITVLAALPLMTIIASKQEEVSLDTSASKTTSPVAKVLLIGLLAWATFHLCLAAIEIINRPVYPWDAWLSWTYRAKAWFYSDTVFQLASPAEWLQGKATTAFNAVGNHYPSFASVMAFWAAISLGQWSETLVNTPVLLCGLALAMGLYGQCREQGMGPLPATIAVYVFLSIPLIGTHLALAGLADIWMAGFAGLGFIAIIRGLCQNNRQQSRFSLGLGLVMVALAMANKNEGAVWFSAALLLAPMVLKPRLSMQVFGLLAALATLAWLTGFTYLEIPGLGGLGFAGGSLHIPLLGSVSLQQFEVWDDYLENFFLNGTWHLLWPLLILSMVALPLVIPTGRLRRSIVCFYLVVAATQGVIFWLTAQGQWADDSTAINRLPLHIAPALVFCLAIIGHKISGFRHSRARTYTPPLAALLLTSAAIFIYLYAGNSANNPHSDTPARAFNPQEMRIVVGAGGLREGVGIINQFSNGIAIVSSGPITLDAAALNALQIETGGDNQMPAGFFWRRKDDPANVEKVPLPSRGKQGIDLSQTPQWTGTVTEIGVIFYEDKGRTAELHSLLLTPKSIQTELRKLGRDWSQFEPWTQASAHWTAAGARQPKVSLPLVVTLWLLLTLTIFLLLTRRYPLAPAAIGVYALIGWMLLDTRWTINGVIQAEHSLTYFKNQTRPPHLDLGGDQAVALLVDEAKQHMSESTEPVLIFSTEPTMRFQILRAKYQLLPVPGFVHEGGIATLPQQHTGYVLMVNPAYLAPGQTAPGPEAVAKRLGERLGTQVSILWGNSGGTLFGVSPI